jgi:hypothetical protein
MRRLAVLAACCAGLSACSAGTGARSPEPLKFLSTHDGRTVSVVETRLPPRMSFDDFARNEPKMLVRAMHARRVRTSQTRIGGRPALRLTYVLPQKLVLQYFVRSGARMYVVTYASKRR